MSETDDDVSETPLVIATVLYAFFSIFWISGYVVYNNLVQALLPRDSRMRPTKWKFLDKIMGPPSPD